MKYLYFDWIEAYYCCHRRQISNFPKPRNFHGNENEPWEKRHSQTPVLIRGIPKEATIEDLLLALPPRKIADELVSRCLDSGEPSLSMFIAFLGIFLFLTLCLGDS